MTAPGGAIILSKLWECTLSPQQQEILNRLKKGETRKQIAASMGIKPEIVRNQTARIREKYQKFNEGGVHKNGTFTLSQYQCALFETPMAELNGEIADMIGELEVRKGLSITQLQKEIIALKTSGKRPKEIAADLGVSSNEIQAELDKIRAEIRRAQYSDSDTDDDSGIGDTLPGGLTEREAQVLAYAKNGMSVKSMANKLGISANAVKKRMYRSGTSVRRIRAQKKEGPRFKHNHYVPVDPDLSRLRFLYFTGALDKKSKISAELVLRSAGLIKAVPTIMENNGQVLNMLSNSKGKRIFHVSLEDEKLLRRKVPGLKGSILDYAGASLIMTNRYAAEEEESEGSSFVHTYAVSEKFWMSVQAVAAPPLTAKPEKETGPVEEDRVSGGSRVSVRLIETGEAMDVCMPGRQSSSPDDFLLSREAPLAKALYGKKAGEKVVVEVSKEKVEYEVLKVVQGV